MIIKEKLSKPKVNLEAYFANESYVTFVGLLVLFTVGHRIKVDVYRNSRKNCYSIRYKGCVIGYAKWVQLENVKFVVSEAGRLRSLRIGRKTVHAIARGYLVALGDDVRPDPENMRHVSYDRYENTSFMVNTGTGKKIPIYAAANCTLGTGGAWVEQVPATEEKPSPSEAAALSEFLSRSKSPSATETKILPNLGLKAEVKKTNSFVQCQKE